MVMEKDAGNWLKKDLKYIWHPYTQTKDCRALPPVFIQKARGIKLYDNRGNFYYDTISSWWCNVHGHNHPKIKKAVKGQMDVLEHVLFAGFTHQPAIELAERLAGIAPSNLTRVFFSDDGSTAVETALKMSFQYWCNKGKREKTRFVSLDRGYHGDTVGAMSVSGVDLFNKLFSPLFFKSYKVPTPYCYRCPSGRDRGECDIDCIKPLEKLLQKKHREICGIILEPLLLAAGGMIVYPAEYLKRAARLAKKYNIHLIIDEVATGFGRTGKMFACNHAGVSPDFICLSKGLTAGYLPMGVTMTTEKIYRAFYADYGKRKTFYHGHTYTANPLACAAACASLDIFKEEGTLDNVNRLAPVLTGKMEGFRDHPLVGDVRSIGMIGAIELVSNRETKQGFGARRIGLEIYRAGLREHLLLRPLGDIIYLFLPLSVTGQEIEEIIKRMRRVLTRVSGKE